VRTLITGVTGQDGWYLSELLAARAATVFGLVLEQDALAVPPGVLPLVGDVRDAASLRRAVHEAEPDLVVNLASLSSVAQSWREPELVADVNGTGTLRLLDAVREWRDDGAREVRFVQASSAEVFGAAPAPQTESTPIAPITPYGAAKAFAQHCVGAYRGAGLWACSAILFNHESPRRPDGFVTRKITKAVAGIATGGTERLALGSLDVRRDWGYARDYADAMLRLAGRDEPSDYVVATGESRTIADFVAAAFAHAGIADWQAWVDIDPALRRPGDAPEQRGDATRLRADTGWAPTLDFAGLVGLMVDAELRRTTNN
jgi:GDPmannose 4,6-dehydratase